CASTGVGFACGRCAVPPVLEQATTRSTPTPTVTMRRSSIAVDSKARLHGAMLAPSSRPAPGRSDERRGNPAFVQWRISRSLADPRSYDCVALDPRDVRIYTIVEFLRGGRRWWHRLST